MPSRPANVHAAATTARPECSCSTGVRLESLRARHADPDPAALAAGQLQDKVQAVLPRPRHPLRSQAGVSDGNSSVSRRQQITFRATLIFHLIYGLLSTTKFGERAFSHAGPATWNVLPDHIRTVADPVKFRKLLKSHYFSQAFNIC